MGEPRYNAPLINKPWNSRSDWYQRQQFNLKFPGRTIAIDIENLRVLPQFWDMVAMIYSSPPVAR
jgi:hypothetical protein